MKYKLALLLLLTINTVLGQTASHKVIEGTKCSIIPPVGFVPSSSFSGFQKVDAGASIMVTEMPVPYEVISNGFTTENLLKKGMMLTDKQSINFNGGKAFLLKVNQQANSMTYLKEMLIFGVDKKTIMIVGIYPEADKELSVPVHQSLLSTIYNKNQDSDPEKAAKFSIDVTGTGFKFDMYLAGALGYKRKDPVPADIIVSSSLGKVAIPDKKQFCISRLKQMPDHQNHTIETISPIEIDGLMGYDLVARGKDKDKKDEIFYQVILFNGEGEYFLIAAYTSGKLEENLKDFKTIARSFKVKRSS